MGAMGRNWHTAKKPTVKDANKQAEILADIEKDIEEYLAKGGKIEQVPNALGSRPFKAQVMHGLDY